jgi:hypothetical protein
MDPRAADGANGTSDSNLASPAQENPPNNQVSHIIFYQAPQNSGDFTQIAADVQQGSPVTLQNTGAKRQRNPNHKVGGMANDTRPPKRPKVTQDTNETRRSVRAKQPSERAKELQ